MNYTNYFKIAAATTVWVVVQGCVFNNNSGKLTGSGSSRGSRSVSIDSSGGLQDGFTADAATIGKPARDGVSGTITNTGGSDYCVRSINGTWWMLQNADKKLNRSDCTYSSINRGRYGHLYSWNCAPMACPEGWSLPTNDEFRDLATWLSSNGNWDDWNRGFSLAGYGAKGKYVNGQGAGGGWWSSSSIGRRWFIGNSGTSGYFFANGNEFLGSVRCKKNNE
ncbi:hypothetical protein FACS189456_3230 [Bacteroidia bacterium]|nr:hypothetical protein FACS189456_3230 [Bacteroidia bacterium]